MPPRLLLPQGLRQISVRVRILRARPSRQVRQPANSRLLLVSQTQASSIQRKRSYRKAFSLRAVGAFEGFVDGPFGGPGDANNDQNPETLALANGRREFPILRMACSRFLRIQQNAIRRAFCDAFSFGMIRKFQRAAPRGDLQFFRADKGDLRDGGDISCRTNEGVIGKNFHCGGSGGGKNQAAGAKVRLCAVRKAVQSDTAPAGQIEQRARAAKLKQALGLRREAVTVVDRGSRRNSGGVEMSGGSLRYNTKRRDSSGPRGQRDAHQEKCQRRSQDAAAHTRSKLPREVHCQFRRCVRGCAGTVRKRLLAASAQAERYLSRSARCTGGQARAKQRAARSDRIIITRWRAAQLSSRIRAAGAFEEELFEKHCGRFMDCVPAVFYAGAEAGASGTRASRAGSAR